MEESRPLFLYNADARRIIVPQEQKRKEEVCVTWKNADHYLEENYESEGSRRKRRSRETASTVVSIKHCVRKGEKREGEKDTKDNPTSLS